MKFYVIFVVIILSISAKPAKRECDPFPNCLAIYRPICGSDGVTYGNSCIFNAAVACTSDLLLAHYGECESPV